MCTWLASYLFRSATLSIIGGPQGRISCTLRGILTSWQRPYLLRQSYTAWWPRQMKNNLRLWVCPFGVCCKALLVQHSTNKIGQWLSIGHYVLLWYPDHFQWYAEIGSSQGTSLWDFLLLFECNMKKMTLQEVGLYLTSWSKADEVETQMLKRFKPGIAPRTPDLRPIGQGMELPV